MPRRHSTEIELQDAVLQSINVTLDAEAPQRIAHFHPTAKCVPLLEALLARRNQRAWMVTAPYGSGKSLTASYLLHLVENREPSRQILKSLESRLRNVSPKLGKLASARRRAEKPGLVIALEGHQANVPEALKRSALSAMKRNSLGRQARTIESAPCESMEEAIQLLSLLAQKLAETGRDRLVIIWDEFGRHLEELVESGRGRELANIQLLAEYVAREKAVSVTLGVFLHQQLLSYADRATQSMRKEWAKVQGRFEQHQYIDDSQETLQLVADLVSEISRYSAKPPTKRKFQEFARKSLAQGWFTGWTQKALSELLEQAFPLEPAALAFLPRVSARIAQNERTLFSFLRSAPLDRLIGLHDIYDFFAPVMRSDTGVGGAHRRWLETESALSKVDAEGVAPRILKSCSLLGLGFGGERVRSTLSAVVGAASGYGTTAEIESEVEGLLQKKLLLHRKHTDQLSLWHGTDVDIRVKLDAQKDAQRSTFDVLRFLAEEFPAPVWKPVAHNDKFGLRRFVESKYFSPDQLEHLLSSESAQEGPAPGVDAQLFYIITDDASAIEHSLTLIRGADCSPRFLFAVAKEPTDIADLALELRCLMTLQEDQELLAQDPLVVSELDQFIDDARVQLKLAVQVLLEPDRGGSAFYSASKEIGVTSSFEFRGWLSCLMDEHFSKTPRIRNEMINRHGPSRVIVNARRKAEIAVLERSGQENLGLVGKTPDVSLFRSALLLTGLYRKQEDAAWGFAQPDEIADAGLSEVWALFKEFFDSPSSDEKHPEELITRLQMPPFGMRRGVIPLLLAASYRAFASATSITRDGRYLDDVLATDIETLIKEPERHRVRVLELDKGLADYLEKVRDLFSPNGAPFDSREQDLIRDCYDVIEYWKQELPPASVNSTEVSEAAKSLQAAVYSDQEPVSLLLKTFPTIAGKKKPSASVIKKLEIAKRELEDVPEKFIDAASKAIVRCLSIEKGFAQDALDAAARWISCFPDGMAEQMGEDSRLKGAFDRLAMDYSKPENLVNSLGLLLVSKPVQRWSESTVLQFEGELDAVVRRIEELAFASAQSLAVNGARTKLAELAETRVSEWFDHYRQLANPKEIENMLKSLREKASSKTE